MSFRTWNDLTSPESLFGLSVVLGWLMVLWIIWKHEQKRRKK